MVQPIPSGPVTPVPPVTPEHYPTHDVGSLQQVLASLADPIRLEMVRRLVSLDAVPCQLLYDGVSKSTASHHFKILREAGVTERSAQGGQTLQRLRLAEVDARHPGVLASILDAADREHVGTGARVGAGEGADGAAAT